MAARDDGKIRSAGAQAHFDKEGQDAIKPFADHEVRLLSRIGETAFHSLSWEGKRVKAFPGGGFQVFLSGYTAQEHLKFLF